jgi:hypothetical protein
VVHSWGRKLYSRSFVERAFKYGYCMQEVFEIKVVSDPTLRGLRYTALDSGSNRVCRNFNCGLAFTRTRENKSLLNLLHSWICLWLIFDDLPALGVVAAADKMSDTSKEEKNERPWWAIDKEAWKRKFRVVVELKAALTKDEKPLPPWTSEDIETFAKEDPVYGPQVCRWLDLESPFDLLVDFLLHPCLQNSRQGSMLVVLVVFVQSF